ncbi:group III truncated hemoglobin [Streptomyces chattanoogensis]|uniref:group III truncated hemoglobin n=1 Tax=Streptomyces chattanoogensis TaxID=66876 RepID=UPI0006B65910|nr:group III truncated hemoglobin [Streptomyces chattanoogensis]
MPIPPSQSFTTDKVISAIVAAIRSGNDQTVDALLLTVANSPDPHAVFALRQALQQHLTQPAKAPPPSTLTTRAGVRRLVETFYEAAADDDLLAPVFAHRGTPLIPHIDTLTDFWCHQLFGHLGWRGALLEAHQCVHATHPLTDAHFTRWLYMWQDSVDAAFVGPAAEYAKDLATRIAHSMRTRLPNCPSG